MLQPPNLEPRVEHEVKVPMILSLDANAIIYLVNFYKHSQAMSSRQPQDHIPVDAKVTFDVPSGGDYSGCDVDVTDQNKVNVRWRA